jgi:hypothetical protein
MKNQSKKALLLLSGLLLAATSAKAEGQYDGSSFWYGFIVGVNARPQALAGFFVAFFRISSLINSPMLKLSKRDMRGDVFAVEEKQGQSSLIIAEIR